LEEVGAITDAAGDATKTAIPSPMSGMDSSVINNTVRGRVVDVFRTSIYASPSQIFTEYATTR